MFSGARRPPSVAGFFSIASTPSTRSTTYVVTLSIATGPYFRYHEFNALHFHGVEEPGMNVRARVKAGKGVAVGPLAIEAGVSPSGLYHLISQEKIKVIRIGARIIVPAEAAAPLLGLRIEEAAAA